MPNILTDSQGLFEIFSLKPGRYSVNAYKDDDGFGDADFGFYASNRPASPIVDISENQTATVTIDVGDPMGRLSVDIVDVDTNEPLAASRFRLSVADNPAIFISSNPDGSAHFVQPVPPVPVVFEVTKPGYGTWHSERILVKSGEIKRLIVALKRTKSP